MACKSIIKRRDKIIKNETPNNLKEKGRIKFFFHAPSSDLPIRDVLGEQVNEIKTEPHIKDCYQKYIKNFSIGDEKYLFLMTTCRNKKLTTKNNKRFIVGYIEKDFIGKRGSSAFIKGTIYIYTFDDSIPTSELKYSNHVRMKLIGEKETRMILDHFGGRKNIIVECVKEIIYLDKNNVTCKKANCLFAGECLRGKVKV